MDLHTTLKKFCNIWFGYGLTIVNSLEYMRRNFLNIGFDIVYEILFFSFSGQKNIFNFKNLRYALFELFEH